MRIDVAVQTSRSVELRLQLKALDAGENVAGAEEKAHDDAGGALIELNIGASADGASMMHGDRTAVIEAGERGCH